MSDIFSIAVYTVQSFKEPSAVMTVLVVVSYLAFLKVILRTWEKNLLSPEPMLKTLGKQR